MNAVKTFNFVLIFVFAFSLLGLPAPASAQELTPYLEANPDKDYVQVYNWPVVGTWLTLTINNGSPFNAKVEQDPWDPSGTRTYFNLNDFDLKAGDNIKVTDIATPPYELTYTVGNLAMTGFDLATNTISGIGNPDEPGEVYLNTLSNGSITLPLTLDEYGKWTVSFSDFSAEDLVAGSNGGMYQPNQGVNHTFVNWTIPRFRLGLINPSLQVEFWPFGTYLTLTINGDIENTLTTSKGGDDVGGSMDSASFNLTGFTLNAGDILKVNDDALPPNEVTYTVSNLSISSFDLAANTVSGTGTPGVDVQVCFNVINYGYCIWGSVPAPSDGIWTFNFNEIGIDLKPGDDIVVLQTDQYGNTTGLHGHVPNTRIGVRLGSDMQWVFVHEWAMDKLLTLTVTGKGTFGPVPVEAGTGGDYATQTGFQLAGDTLVPGDHLSVSDGTNSIAMVVGNPVVTGVDQDTDILTGTADPYSRLFVWACDFACAMRYPLADKDGNWFANFHDPEEGHMGEVIDFSPGMGATIGQYDGDSNNSTMIGWRIPRPYIQTNPTDGWVQAFDWPIESTLTLTINGVTTFQGIAGNPVDPNNPLVDFPLDGFNLQPGYYLEVSDGSLVKGMIVGNLVVTVVDPVYGTVSGTADPVSELIVWVCDDNDPDIQCSNRSTWSDEFGSWQVDFKQGQEVPNGMPFNLLPGTSGGVVQFDTEGNRTEADWKSPDGYGVIGSAGGLIETEDGAVTMDVPAGALENTISLSITEGSSGYEVAGDQVTIQVVSSFNIQPDGTTFDLPVAITFSWTDDDVAGTVDGTALLETNLLMIKDGTVISPICEVNPACDMVANTLTVEVTSLSLFELAALENTPPLLQSISAPDEPREVNTLINATATFLDPDLNDIHTATWDWGDGQTSPGTVDESNQTISGSHTYALAGVYTVQVTVTEANNATASASFMYVVIYDPSAGFVTGGGWINSPAGAYTADPSLTGKATFGFISKYQKGTNVPTGNTEFQFKVGNMNFSSTAYDWLVIAGAKAQYKGVGTINGTGSYRFMLTAIDGQINGGGGVDKFRIKIWDLASEQVVYDNQLDAGDDAIPTTIIQGGSIVIHK